MERATGDRRLEIVDHRVEADLLAAEVPVEQAVVLRLGDHRLDHASRWAAIAACSSSFAGRVVRVPPELS